MADETKPAEFAIGKSPANLIKRLQENRKLKVKVGRFTFTCRRPTDLESAQWYRNGQNGADLFMNFVIDWDGVQEKDVMGGGGTDLLPFDLGLWQTWVVDRMDLWEPIANAIKDAYRDHQKDMEAIEKN
jgi:hypothetical protein